LRGCQLSCGFAPISHWVAVIIVVAAVAGVAGVAVAVAVVAASLFVDTSVTLSHAFSPRRKDSPLPPFGTAHCLHAHQQTEPSFPEQQHTHKHMRFSLRKFNRNYKQQDKLLLVAIFPQRNITENPYPGRPLLLLLLLVLS